MLGPIIYCFKSAIQCTVELNISNIPSLYLVDATSSSHLSHDIQITSLDITKCLLDEGEWQNHLQLRTTALEKPLQNTASAKATVQKYGKSES